MVDIWELSQFVEGHPENQEQRWRLIKAFYKDKDYRLALEHLQILENELPDKKNLYRYLAATYYRLTRFDEAEKVVMEALARWPDDLKFQEQHAQILQESGDLEGAAAKWEDIAATDPDHRFARKAVKQLRKHAAKEYDAVGGVGGGVPQTGSVPCPQCGAGNEPEFVQCWKCHGGLSLSDSFAPPTEPREEVKTPFYEPITKGLVPVLVILGAYLTFREWSWRSAPEHTNFVFASAYEYYVHGMFMTRLAAGVLFLVLWPFVMRLSVYVTGSDDVDYDWLAMCGLFFATLTYATTWLPAGLQWISLACFIFVPLGTVLATFPIAVGQRLTAWGIQFFIVTLLAVTLAGAMNGIGMVRDLPKLAALVMGSADGAHSALARDDVTPVALDAVWESTGSEWLDSKVDVISLTTTLDAVSGRVFIEVTQDQSILAYEELDRSPYRLDVRPIKPGIPYRIRVFGVDGVPVQVASRGMLPYRAESTLP
jgi:hypothetical protein